MHLKSGVHDFPLHLCVPEFCRRSLFSGQFSGDMPCDRPVNVCPTDLKFGRQACEHETGILKVEHPLSKRFAVFRDLNGLIERALRDGLSGYRYDQALLRQLTHQAAEAAILLAEKILYGHADVIEK
jgi:hypothetical protein